MILHGTDRSGRVLRQCRHRRTRRPTEELLDVDRNGAAFHPAYTQRQRNEPLGSVDAELACRRRDGEIAVPLGDFLEGVTGVGGRPRPFQGNDHLVRLALGGQRPEKELSGAARAARAAWT